MKLRTIFLSILFALAPVSALPQRGSGEGAASFHLGMAGYTFNKFDIDKTLSFMKKIDVHYLCIKDFHLPIDASADQIAAFKAKLAEANVIGEIKKIRKYHET